MKNQYPENDYRNYLEHHGILGMKWGIKNGPPYPLGDSDHSASEKKAGWRDSLSRTTDMFKANKELKESGFYHADYDSRWKKNLWLYDDGRGDDRYQIYLEHDLRKDSYEDVKKKIQTVKRASKSYETIQKNINNHCKKVLEDRYGKGSLQWLVEPHAFEARLSGVQEMTVLEPNILSIWAEYSRTSNPHDTRTVDIYDIKYDLKKHKALNIGMIGYD